MMPLTSLAALPSSLLGAGSTPTREAPASRPPDNDLGFVDLIQAEGDAIVGSLSSPWAWLAIGAIIAVLIGTWYVRRVIRHADNLSTQVRALLTSGLELAALLLVVGLAMLFLHSQAPLLTGLSLGLLGVFAVVAIAWELRDWVRAIIALWQGRIRIGSYLGIGEVRGRVVEVGPFRVTVENPDGGLLYVPTARFAREIYEVASPERVFPVDVHVVDNRPLTEEELGLLRRVAILSPYRESDSPVVVDPGPDPHSAQVRFRSWSEEGARLARVHLMAGFARFRDSVNPAGGD